MSEATRFTYRSTMPATAKALFDWHERPGALLRLIPPWQKFRVVQLPPDLRDGSRAIIELQLGPLRRRIIAEHIDYVPGQQFADHQVSGPFASWRHTHRMIDDGPHESVLEDDITYQLPLGSLGRVLGGRVAHRALGRVFAYRHTMTQGDLAVHNRYNLPPLRIAVSGASGLVGSALCAQLSTGGHTVIRLARKHSNSDNRNVNDFAAETIEWSPRDGTIDADGLADVDVVVHLAGAGIADGRWTDARKKIIRDSRVDGTALLARTLAARAKAGNPPRAFICASAIGYYGSRGDTWLDETSPRGDGFLADVVEAWEGAADPAREAGIRTAHLRFGMVLSAEGGALAKMLLPFKLGLGGRVGSGQQYWSWIARDDATDAILHAIATEAINGPVNVASPEPPTNLEFTKTLGRVLRRPTIAPLPAFAARLALGEMADELLLASARVKPARLEATGFAWRYPDLASALRHTLGRTEIGQ